MDTTSHVDLSVINDLKDLMDDEFATLINIYIADSTERLNTLFEALRAQDAEQIWAVGHSFKGASSNLGAFPLAHLLQSVENAGHDHQLDVVGELLPQVKKEYAAVISILKAHI